MPNGFISFNGKGEKKHASYLSNGRIKSAYSVLGGMRSCGHGYKRDVFLFFNATCMYQVRGNLDRMWKM